jgi:DNA adenine methylase
MTEPYSPLRYPGGKASLTPFLAGIIKANQIHECAYIEPYAGGAGAALGLLFGEHVERIRINDADPRIFAFWWTITERPDSFFDLLDKTQVTVDEWRRQRAIYLYPKRHSRTKVGFATFFLNRCNRSGILVNGGPIGGYEQSGKWKLDARYDRGKLQKRIERILLYRDRIEVSDLDAVALMRETIRDIKTASRTFVYLDPPYYQKGSQLYLNSYDHEDHLQLQKLLKRKSKVRWLVSYDNVAQIREIYSDFQQIEFDLRYTAYDRRQGHELLIFDNLLMPESVAALLPAG